MADALLKRKLAAFQGEPEAPAAKPKPKPTGRPNTPKNRATVPADGIPSAASLTPKGTPAKAPGNHREGTEADLYHGDVPRGAMTVAQAVERARARARGELVD